MECLCLGCWRASVLVQAECWRCVIAGLPGNGVSVYQCTNWDIATEDSHAVRSLHHLTIIDHTVLYLNILEFSSTCFNPELYPLSNSISSWNKTSTFDSPPLERSLALAMENQITQQPLSNLSTNHSISPKKMGSKQEKVNTTGSAGNGLDHHRQILQSKLLGNDKFVPPPRMLMRRTTSSFSIYEG